MSIAEIKKLPLAEKFQLMESLWQDLHAEISSASVPLAHQQLLDERRARVAAGKAQLLDWDSAKNLIGQK